MPIRIEQLADIAGQYGAIVLDQWGVLHDGSAPYEGAVDALHQLRSMGVRLAVLSNSGKRAAPNCARIAGMGFDPDLFDVVMTSGEALWQDIANERATVTALCPIERAEGDAADWAVGLDITLIQDPRQADGILLMGLPDGAAKDMGQSELEYALSHNLPVYCTNPDRSSPRPGGVTVVSPGALAHAHADAGGTVQFFGKPHAPVFRAMEAALGISPDRLLMVGDSLEHDIAGGHNAGWSTAFIESGLHAATFISAADTDHALENLSRAEGAPCPTFTLSTLR